MSYRPGRPHRLAELVPLNQFLGSINVKKFRLWLLKRFTNTGSVECAHLMEAKTTC
jgi:hypothetical protein